MKKLSFAFAAAAVAVLGFAGHADAQTYYPPTRSSNVPTHVQPAATGTYGTYGTYPQYPGYPGQYQYPQQQYPTTAASHERHERDRDRYARRDNDGDRDDRGAQSGYRYGVSNNVPTHVRAEANTRGHSNGQRDRYDRDHDGR